MANATRYAILQQCRRQDAVSTAESGNFRVPYAWRQSSIPALKLLNLEFAYGINLDDLAIAWDER